VGSVSAEEESTSASTLRALGAQVQLRIGTATLPDDLTDPNLSPITADQFSVLTPGNDMKWQVVEPTQGVFDWTGADNLVNFAEAHRERVRGHTLVWHNQLPNWLTQGVANGTISNSQLLDLLHQHITTEVSRYRGRIWQWDVVNEMLTDSNPSQVNPNDFWISHLGPGMQPTPAHCSVTTTTTSPVRMAVTPSSMPTSPWSRACWPRKYRSTAWETRATSTCSSGSTRS
jgi:endo-1,4-beta-xylanase